MTDRHADGPSPSIPLAGYAIPLTSHEDRKRIARLQGNLEALRQRLRIPGLSAAVARHGEVVWAQGFGWADIEADKPATPSTLYNLASLTKPFGATVILQLVEEVRLDLETPIAEYGIDLESPGTVRVKHLLSHTSSGMPGDDYAYDGDRFALLGQVMTRATGRPFSELLSARILKPLGLDDTLPMLTLEEQAACAAGRGNPRMQAVWARLAAPYEFVRGCGNVQGTYRTNFSCSAGLVSTVFDYARFDRAISDYVLISKAAQNLAWTPFRSNDGRELPYGYGWFVQSAGSLRYIWHYGYWDCTSTLIVKIPERGLTFLAFANSDRLSSPFGLGADEDVRRSPAARAFLDLFVH